MTAELNRLFSGLTLHKDVDQLRKLLLVSEPSSSPFKIFLCPAYMQKKQLTATSIVALEYQGAFVQEEIFVEAWPATSVKIDELKIDAELNQNLGLEGTIKIRTVDPVFHSSCILVDSVIVTLISGQKTKFECADIESNLKRFRYIVNGQTFRSTDRLPGFSVTFPGQEDGPSIFYITSDTKFMFHAAESARDSLSSVILNDTLMQVHEKLVKIISFRTRNSDSLSAFRVKAPRGAIIYGPSGTGKTLFVLNAFKDSHPNIVYLDASDVFGKYLGESEGKLRDCFDRAKAKAPSLFVIDNVELLCGRRNGTNPGDSHLVTIMLSMMDSLGEGRERVFFIGITNKIESIDPAMRRPGRFDYEVEFATPNLNDRRQTLERLLEELDHDLDSQAMQEVARNCPGFVLADLKLLLREASLLMIRGNARNISFSHLMNCLNYVKPSALADSIVEVPATKWDDIAGQAETKMKLKESVELPLKHPEIYKRLGLKPPKGILLYGPPGCSKTLLAKALASESGLNFMAVKGPEIFSKWVGDSEKALAALFRRARQASPSIIFFDEFDSIGSKRDSSGSSSVKDRVISQLLTELDGLDSLNQITVIAATNRPASLDPALLRPGRLDRHIYVKLPNREERRSILSLQSSKFAFSPDIDFDALSWASEGYSGAELVYLCQESAYLSLSVGSNFITDELFRMILGDNLPRISPLEVRYFDEFSEQK